MASKSVTVLTPNGRRPTIKISPNTTILQVLEEACQKFNFNPDDYDLKHYNRILDVNLIFRYANISNNACLEMVTCKNPRKVSNVTICVQLESGDRLTGEFSPTVNIKQIFNELGIQYDPETAVVIYTQREIYGKEFETVTLRSLGLGSGKALFRLLHRDLDKLKEQAHVYVPPQPKVLKTDECESDKTNTVPILNLNKNKIIDPVSISKAERGNISTSNIINKTDNKVENRLEENVKENNQFCASNDNNQIKKEEETSMEIDETSETKIQEEEVEEEPQVYFLGERNALLFNQSGARAVHQDDIPDNFFELTINDAKALLRDVKKMQSKLEDSPLLTSAQRELEKDKQKLNRLHKYQKAVIRIQFPNALVLQALFNPTETIEVVKDFVKSYLEYPEADFSLYTTPPRCDLNAENRLIDLDLVPSAIVYYAGSSDLKTDVKSKLTDPTVASFQAAKTRLSMMRKDTQFMIDNESKVNECALASSTATTSRPVNWVSNGTNEPQAGPSRSQPEKSKAPKWFKLSSK